MATAAAAPSSMHDAARTTCSRSASPRSRAHRVVPIDRCPVLAPALDGAIEAAWAIAEALAPDAQAARHPGHGHRCRPRCRRARLGSADRRADGGPRRDRRSPPSRPPDPARRDGGAADEADGGDRPRPRGAAAGRLPAGNGGGRSRPGAAGGGALHRGENGGRPVLRRRTIRAAARRTRPRHRGRQRRRTRSLPCSAPPRSARPQADRGAGARPLPPAVRAGRAQALRCRRVRSATPGRRGAGAGARGVAGARSWSRCRAIRRPSRAMRVSSSTAAIGSSE